MSHPVTFVQSDRDSKTFPQATIITLSGLHTNSVKSLVHPFEHKHGPFTRCQRRTRNVSLQKLKECIQQYVEVFNSAGPSEDKLLAFDTFEQSLAAWSAKVAVKSIKEAIGVFECAGAGSSPNDSNIAFQVFCIARLMQARYERRRSDAADLSSAISKFNFSINLLSEDDPQLPIYHRCLARALNTRFERNKGLDFQHIETSISALQHCLDGMPTTHPLRSGVSHVLSNSHYLRFSQTKFPHDINRAIELQEHVVALSAHPDHLRLLADYLTARFTVLPPPSPDDLDRAIHLATESVDLTKDCETPDLHASCLNSFGSALAAKTYLSSLSAELSRAIVRAHGDAVAACSLENPLRARYLRDLASALILQFRTAKEEKDLDRAVEVLSQAIRCPHSDEEYLTMFANVLILRFQVSGNIKDLNQAIAMAEKASLHGSFQASRELGLALYTRHLRTRNKTDLDRTIVSFATAMVMIREENNKSGLLGFLDSALRDRFEQDGEMTKIDYLLEEVRKMVRRHAKCGDDQLILEVVGDALNNRFKTNDRGAA